MRIISLVENTAGAPGCVPAHGLSFYAETDRHRILIDSGPSGELLLSNAAVKGVDLKSVDTVFLTHGHYDHGGGLAAFSEINPAARIYLTAGAFGEFYSVQADGGVRYIGLSDEVRTLPGLTVPDRDPFFPDDGLMLFSGIRGSRLTPPGNSSLRVKKDGKQVPADFSHELCAAVRESGQTVLFSGCAHSGILNILERYREICGGAPDLVVSGFHMRKKCGFTDEDIHVIIETAKELAKYRSTLFFTCHCTGQGPYEVMKQVMGDRLFYLHCGEEIDTRTLSSAAAFRDASADSQAGNRYGENAV